MFESKLCTQKNMIERKISAYLKKVFLKFPIMTLTGPRQSGKTTLVKELFQNKPYINLEASNEREFALSDPSNFLKRFPDGAILDEVQRVPELLSEIQVFVDKDGRDGLFILTGSQNPSLSKKVSQSLAGRTSLPKLLPFSLCELEQPYKFDLKDQIYYGFYPRLLVKKIEPAEYYGNYVETYLERDVANLIQVKNRSLFIKFMRLCAGRTGQILNKESLSRDLGISPSTAEEWLSVLEATFILFRLPPFYANIGKRLIKAPKLFFYDVGLASYLIGINTSDQLITHPLFGNLFENLQLSEVIKGQYNGGRRENLFFYRDAKGNEIDLLLQIDDSLIAIEIKASSRFDESFLKAFKFFPNITEKDKIQFCLVLGCEENQKRKDIQIINWRGISKFLEEEIEMINK